MDQLPVVEAEHVSQGIFPEIDKLLKQFLTAPILEKQRREMRRCVFYLAKAAEPSEVSILIYQGIILVIILFFFPSLMTAIQTTLPKDKTWLSI
jgi:hypothetical protein